MAYGWGRNETGQLGLGYTSAVVPLPTQLSIPGEETQIEFVAAAVGKYHTLLVGKNGLVYASGGNGCGQLGINNAGVKQIEKFRKCSVMGQVEQEDGGDVTVKIVKVRDSILVILLYCINLDLYIYTCCCHSLALFSLSTTSKHAIPHHTGRLR